MAHDLMPFSLYRFQCSCTVFFLLLLIVFLLQNFIFSVAQGFLYTWCKKKKKIPRRQWCIIVVSILEKFFLSSFLFRSLSPYYPHYIKSPFWINNISFTRIWLGCFFFFVFTEFNRAYELSIYERSIDLARALEV